MVAVGSSSFTVSDLSPADGGLAAGPTVVWLSGEHDASTDSALSLTLARAIAFDPRGLVLDLSEVTFMSTSTLGVIVRAREYLREHSASLTVRSPSQPVLLLVSACGLGYLLGPGPDEVDNPTGEALSSWVSVPVVGPADGQPGTLAPPPGRSPGGVASAMAPRAQAVSAGRHAAESTTKVAVLGRL
jgi:anti-anti-sigma factor